MILTWEARLLLFREIKIDDFVFSRNRIPPRDRWMFANFVIRTGA